MAPEQGTTYRGYRVVPLGTFAMLKIMPPGSGSIPAELQGYFTNWREAKIAIDRSFDSMKSKGRGRKSDGKEGSTSSN